MERKLQVLWLLSRWREATNLHLYLHLHFKSPVGNVSFGLMLAAHLFDRWISSHACTRSVVEDLARTHDAGLQGRWLLCFIMPIIAQCELHVPERQLLPVLKRLQPRSFSALLDPK
jgi:hypothetical protein